MVWYNYDKINSYNAMLNIIMTNRGFGKSYGSKMMAIKNFIKKGEQFVYVRRFKTEITKQFKQFFDDIKQELKTGDRCNVASAVFSMYSYQELKKQLSSIDV